MAKVLVFGDAGVHSGFGTVTHNIFERLVTQYGHDVSVLAVNWTGDHIDTPLKMYLPTQKMPADHLGQSRYVEMMGKVMPDVMVFINDPQVVMNTLLGNEFDPTRILWNGFEGYKPPILAYMPIDGYNSPKSWDVLLPRVERIAMSNFGQTAMPEAPVVHHGVDTSIFKPMDKKAAKVALGFDPDRFLVLRVDKNSLRKDYAASWKAVRPLLRRFSDMDVHFHCRPVAADSYNLHAVAFNDEDIRDRLTFTPDLSGYFGLDANLLATLYNAADVFVSTSWGEGFGLTILEAMACGTPVVAQDCSAITEVVGDAGILVPPGPSISTPMGQDMHLPDINAFTQAIERLYLGHGSRRKLAEAAVAQAAKFSWDTAAGRFNDLITWSLDRKETDDESNVGSEVAD